MGGTFTDVVLIGRDGSIRTDKVLSTPPRFSEGIMRGLSLLAEAAGIDLKELLNKTDIMFHGTTVADNAVFTKTGSKVGLLTTRGFEDTLIMARGALGRWSGLTENEIKHVVANEKPKPIVPRTRIEGIVERTDYKGRSITSVSEEEVIRASRRLVENHGVESIAVSLLWSFRNPENERKVRSAIKAIYHEMFVTLSSDLAPFLGEYERTSTVALNAYVGPMSGKYLEGLLAQLNERGFRGDLLIMQGYGGVLPYKEAWSKAVGLIESGPAAGIKSCAYLGQVIGVPNILACDMGGTTFKVGMVTDGEIEYSRDANIGGYNYVIPKMDITSIGAGGGSLVTVDQYTKIPSVGPKSAEANPGPVCYDLGGKVPTVTDVDLILGLIDPLHFLGGRMKINKQRATQQFKPLVAEPLALDVLEAAASIYRITNAQMADLIHKVTVERGLDPRDYTLFSYGGAASIHMCAVCDELGISRMVVPFAASVNGALGAASSDVIYEYVATNPLVLPVEPSIVDEAFEKLREKALSQLRGDGFKEDDILLERSVDMRFRLQTHELTVPLTFESWTLSSSDLKELERLFGVQYEQKYGKGSAYREAGVEMITFRLKATGKLEKYKLMEDRQSSESADGASLIERRQAYFNEGTSFASAGFYSYDHLKPGNLIRGPSVILAPTTTVVVNPGWTVKVDSYRNLRLSRDQGN